MVLWTHLDKLLPNQLQKIKGTCNIVTLNYCDVLPCTYCHEVHDIVPVLYTMAPAAGSSRPSHVLEHIT